MTTNSLCEGWSFAFRWDDALLAGGFDAVPVRLPHTVREVPLHMIDPEGYQTVCGYRRELTLPPEYRGKRLFLRFDGAAHQAVVYVNGREAGRHRCGYTGFRVEITHLVRYDGPNHLAVRLDTTEDPDIPPFGFVIDYLTFGGLYREVWLEAAEESYLPDLYVVTPDLTSFAAQVTADGPREGLAVRGTVLDPAGRTVWSGRTALPAEGPAPLDGEVPGAEVWTVDRPRLYLFRAELVGPDGTVLDRREVPFGFRTAQFRADGFYLNGQKVFLRGLDRHQSWPYVGYAAPRSLQREDARILKEELGCNAVRTSHYPQSQHFLDQCDKLGLLVFTEIPGWQHIGPEGWKEQALQNLREMILQNRSHPSVVLWGVRINESADDDDFYARANALAHRLDPSRQTSGVRNFTMSHLLEDVYAYNDFSHDGRTPGVLPKEAVTPDLTKGLIVSECNGHMFPTKPWDDWALRQEQALRHLRVQNDALQSGVHGGCLGWCMFDYPTHPDFGAGDRVCYHGVMDAFRNPKLAAWAYLSQQDQRPVLEVGSNMDIGDYPASLIGEVYVFTNAQRVELYQNGKFLKALKPGPFPALPHPPFLLEQADLGVWGGQASRWSFRAYWADGTVREAVRAPSARLHLELTASAHTLTEGDSYDMAALRLRLVDEYGAVAPYVPLVLRFTVEGPLELVGPDAVALEGGMAGCYLRTVGRAGTAAVVVTADGVEPVRAEFTVKV